jgi:hypothetical protein
VYLAELVRRDGVIALSFHVDCWNYIGWNDPFSSPEATARPRAYGRSMKKRYVYTPQIVVDGRVETVGSNRAIVSSLITMTAAAHKIEIDVTHNKGGRPISASPMRCLVGNAEASCGSGFTIPR